MRELIEEAYELMRQGGSDLRTDGLMMLHAAER
jgi:hypothetical protein